MFSNDEKKGKKQKLFKIQNQFLSIMRSLGGVWRGWILSLEAYDTQNDDEPKQVIG
jgi:hypothetical protein